MTINYLTIVKGNKAYVRIATCGRIAYVNGLKSGCEYAYIFCNVSKEASYLLDLLAYSIILRTQV